MTILWILAGVVLVLLGTLFVVGALLPRDHVAAASLVVNAPPDAVWRRIRTVADLPSWRPSIKKVEIREGPADAPAAWTEHAKHDALKLSVVRSEPARLLETRIDDAGLPFGGTWTFELSPASTPDATRLRLTERGFIKLPPFRVIAKLFLGHHASIRAYLTDLAHATGSTSPVEIEKEP